MMHGYIFGCTDETYDECIKDKVFGLPKSHLDNVLCLRPGTPIFLFNYTKRVMHGVFVSKSEGRQGIKPYGWVRKNSRNTLTLYPAQIEVDFFVIRPPLPESKFRKAIMDNYDKRNIKFSFGLTEVQVKDLCKLFGSKVPGVTNIESLPPPGFEDIKDEYDDQASCSNTRQNGDRIGSWKEVFGKKPGDEDLCNIDIYLLNEKMKEAINNEYIQKVTKRKPENNLAHPIPQNHVAARPPAQMANLVKHEQPEEESLKSEEFSFPILSQEPIDAWSLSLQNQQNIIENRKEVTIKKNMKKLDPAIKEYRKFKQSPNRGWEDPTLGKAEVEDWYVFHDKTIAALEGKIPLNAIEEYSGVDWTSLEMQQNNPPNYEEVYNKETDNGRIPGLSSIHERFPAKAKNEKLMIFGGYNGTVIFDKTETFCPYRHIWSSGPEIPVQAFVYGGIVRVHNQIYFIGGKDLTPSIKPFTMKILNIDSMTWNETKAPNVNRSMFATELVDDKIILVIGGGDSHEKRYQTVKLYDLEREKWSMGPSMENMRDGIGCCQLNHSIYVVGGFNGRQFVSSIERLDPREGIWKTCGSLEMPYSCAAIKSYQNKIWSVGGYCGKKLTQVSSFDPRINMWEKLQSMSQARTLATIEFLNGELLVIGGSMEAPGAEIFKIHDRKWRSDAQLGLRSERSGHCSCVVEI